MLLHVDRYHVLGYRAEFLDSVHAACTKNEELVESCVVPIRMWPNELLSCIAPYYLRDVSQPVMKATGGS